MARKYDLRCTKECGFVVPADYYEVKRRFQAPYCPRAACGGIVAVYDHGTMNKAAGMVLLDTGDVTEVTVVVREPV